MSEDVLVMNSSPTLAALKTGSLFSLAFQSRDELRTCLRSWNRVLHRKGIVARALRIRNRRALIYVYRPALLEKDLSLPEAAQILKERGYRTQCSEQCIRHLMRQLSSASEFPHEIGLFLGYPPGDVKGFIRDAHGQKFTGLWKVYENVSQTQKLFEKYKRCTEVYCRQFSSGVSLERLAVAG